MKRYTLQIGTIFIPLKLRSTNTASVIKEKLPLSGKGHKWGMEFYFNTFLDIKLENDAKDIITKGEIAFWPNGGAIAIGYGPTPISINNEIRLADKCNIWADTEYNLSELDYITNDAMITVKCE